MTSIVPPSGPTPPFGPTAPAPPARTGATGFAQVFDLAAARARREQALTTPVIPQTVLQEMDSARLVLEALDAQGHELRFDRELGGRIRAELRTVDGTTVRQVPLSEVVDVGSPDSPSAA
jgi:hypothetical protein